MKILKNNMKNEPESLFPLNYICDKCGSELEVDEKDVKIGYAGMAYVVCPVCNCNSYLDIDELDENVTKDTLRFPDHFYHFGGSEGASSVSPEEIKKYINLAIKFFRDNPDNFCWTTSTGDTHIAVFNFCGDQNYSVVVSKNFYETEIPFDETDKRLVTEELWDNRGVKIETKF